MTDRPILFTADEILGPALDTMYLARPSSFEHINLRKGVYWHPFLGFRGQTAANIARLVSLVEASSLRATGQDLLDYVASEYDAIPDTQGSFAVGEVSFTRTTTITAGDIPQGATLSRAANLTTQVPILPSQYELLVPVHFDVGQDVAGPVPVRAKQTGTAANHVIRTDTNTHGVKVTTPLFDSTITVSDFSAAGGAEKADDNFVRKYARAFAVGQYGPTADASRYAVLRATGVRNLLVYDIPGTGTQKILVADASWGSSARWASAVQQSVYDAGLVGHGCKVVVDQIRNKVITINATVVLRDKNYAVDTTEIDLAIRKGAASYFNDRTDWNVWKTRGLQSAITRTHSKILYCSAVTVTDAEGNVLNEVSTPDYTSEQFHLYLANGAMNINYQGPG